jgi:hypothetical protein
LDHLDLLLNAEAPFYSLQKGGQMTILGQEELRRRAATLGWAGSIHLMVVEVVDCRCEMTIRQIQVAVDRTLHSILLLLDQVVVRVQVQAVHSTSQALEVEVVIEDMDVLEGERTSRH